MVSVKFGNYDSWTNWKLYFVDFKTDTRKVRYVDKDLHSTHGKIDDTEAFGSPDYDMKLITITLQAVANTTKKNWLDIYFEVLEAVHGKKMNVVVDGATYNGRVAMTNFYADSDNPTITLEVEI